MILIHFIEYSTSIFKALYLFGRFNVSLRTLLYSIEDKMLSTLLGAAEFVGAAAATPSFFKRSFIVFIYSCSASVWVNLSSDQAVHFARPTKSVNPGLGVLQGPTVALINV